MPPGGRPSPDFAAHRRSTPTSRMILLFTPPSIVLYQFDARTFTTVGSRSLYLRSRSFRFWTKPPARMVHT